MSIQSARSEVLYSHKIIELIQTPVKCHCPEKNVCKYIYAKTVFCPVDMGYHQTQFSCFTYNLNVNALKQCKEAVE